MPQPKTATLAFSARLSVPAVSRDTTMPFITTLSPIVPPCSLHTRTLSTFSAGFLGAAGITAMAACATYGASTDW